MNIMILAAGLSRRMGSAKLALPMGRQTILQRTVNNACLSRADNVYVVLNDDYDFLREDIEAFPVTCILNKYPEEGMSSSIKVGMKKVIQTDDDLMVMLADQPDIKPDLINRLIQSHQTSGSLITQPEYNDGIGHPVIFSRPLFNELLKVEGDEGGKKIIRKYSHKRTLVMIDMEQPTDIDTKEDYYRYLQKDKVVENE